MSLDHILLGLLRDPATGYDLKSTFNERIRHFWSAELSQIYPALKRLEQRRMLRSRVEPSPKGPNRKVYTLTDRGREELLGWLRGGPAVGTERFAYLAQLYFMDAIGDLRETRAFMTELRDHLARWLEQLRSLERDVTDTHGDPERFGDAGFHRFATLRMGIHSIGAKVAWCDETLAAIERRLAARSSGETAATSHPREPETVVGEEARAGVPETVAGVPETVASVPETAAGVPETVAGESETMAGDREGRS